MNPKTMNRLVELIENCETAHAVSENGLVDLKQRIPKRNDRIYYDECLGCGYATEHRSGPKTCPRCGGSAWKKNAWWIPPKRR